jgi:phosphoribosylformylglycinamidine synthase
MVDLKTEKANAALVRTLIGTGLVSAVHDISEGGIACAAVEMLFSANTGATINLGEHFSEMTAAEFLFSETQARYLVSAKNEADILNLLGDVPGVSLGIVDDSGEITFTDKLGGRLQASISLAKLRAANESWLPDYMNSVD